MVKALNFYGLWAMLVLLLFSCKSKNSNESDLKVFRYNESKGIVSLDPAFARNQTIIWPVNQLFNGLVQMDSALNVKPCIAHSWDISPDAKIYTFYLRTDVKFHDHELFHSDRYVNANDVVYSLNRIIDPKVASPGYWIMNPVKRKGDFLDCTALNDSVFQIKLDQAFPGFLGVLTMQYCSIVPKEIVSHYQDDFRSNPIGTGPFYFKFWAEGEKLILLKNENYFEKDESGNQLPYIDAVNISFITDKQSEFLEFLTGKVDFISGVNQVYKDEILTKEGDLKDNYIGRITLLKGPYLNTEYLGFLVDESLQQNQILLNKNIRKAINYGFDRRKMMYFLRNNLGTPAENGFVPGGMPSSDYIINGYSYQPELAKSYLKEAGYENGEGLPEIKLTTTSDYLDLCEFIQFQLSEIGIKLKVEVASGGAFRDLVSNSGLEFFRGSWIADYPEADNYLSLFYSKNFSPNGPNYTHFSSAEYDLLFEQALAENNLEKRKEMYRKLDQMVMDHAIVVPLFYDEVVRLVNPKVEGLNTNPLNLLTLKAVRKK